MASRLVAELEPSGRRLTYAAVAGSSRLAQVDSASQTSLRSRYSQVFAIFSSVFLPVGFPHSVRPEYLRFQQYDTLQAACSYLRNILTTSAILRGVGVGEESASPMAAAIAWVLRDGLGMVGSLIFSVAVGTGFDANVKEWRLFADLINDVGLTLDMLAPLAGRGTPFALIAALGAACKTICGMVAGATRASITAHFALEGNMADVSAKENAQETAVTLAGLLLGTSLASTLGDSTGSAWAAFLLLTALHVYANWIGVGCLCFSWLNRQRAAIVADEWAAHGRVMTPAAVAARERIWTPLLLWLRGPKLGVRLLRVAAEVDELRALGRLYDGQHYLLRVTPEAAIVIALHEDATGSDALRALLLAAMLARSRQSTPSAFASHLTELAESQRLLEQAWPKFEGALLAAGWDEGAMRMEPGYRFTWVLEGQGLQIGASPADASNHANKSA